MKLAIVVPARNEASNIPILFEHLQELLSAWQGDWHVLFVDDGMRGGFVMFMNWHSHRPT